MPSLFDLDFTPPKEAPKPAAPTEMVGEAEPQESPVAAEIEEAPIEAVVEVTPASNENGRQLPESEDAPVQAMAMPATAEEDAPVDAIPEVIGPGGEVDALAPEQPAKAAKRGPAKKADVPVPEDPKGDKQYYTIGEVAELFKVNTSHVRFWTNEFEIKVRTTRKGDRLYTKEQIAEIKTIHHLVKERGFTLSGAKAKLKERKKTEVAAVDLKTSLLQLRSQLVAIRKQLK